MPFPARMSASLHCFGALALEIASPPTRLLLPRDQADEFGAHLAQDLQRLLPGVDALDLVFAAAHFDPAELLRPRWPLYATLSELGARAPGAGRARTIGFGSADGAMAAPALVPEASLAGGPLRLLPFVLLGDAEHVGAVGRAMEERLLETGMAGAATALFAQQAFGGRLEHARYLSLHDLCAMTAMQYEHAGIGALWPLIEAALFDSDGEEWLDAPPEPLLRLHRGDVRAARLSFDAWCEAGFAPVGLGSDALPRAHAAFGHRLRQFAAVLGAHAIALHLVDVDAGQNPRAALAD
jgi:hypothetical protein